MTRGRRLTAVAVAASLGLAAPLPFYLAGNGLTPSALALASLSLYPLVALAATLAPSRRPLCLAVTLALVSLDGAFIASRLASSQIARAPMRYCERAACDATPPLLARLAPEDETTLAGLALSNAIGAIAGAERDELERLLRREQKALVGPLSHLPNAPLAGLVSGRFDYLYARPEGQARPPAVVFLHGFGGQLSVYLSVMLSSELAQRYAIIAPFGGPTGAFFRDSEVARLSELLDQHLPPDIDRDRLYLVGLSNGAIGATVVAASPRMKGRFRAVAALSGLGVAADPTPPMLVVTGRSDPRFSLGAIEQRASALRAIGAEVRLDVIEGDHFIVLSQKHDVWSRVASFFDEHP